MTFQLDRSLDRIGVRIDAPKRALSPLATDIENLASSYFLKITALFAQLQRRARSGPLASRHRNLGRPVWAVKRWLAWEDSNLHITSSENAFERSTEFPLFWPE